MLSTSLTPTTPSASSGDPRNIRQRDLVPDAALSRMTCLVVGTGAIGRQVALQLAAIGAPRQTLVDFDIVETANLAAQGFYPSQLGTPKVDAVAAVALSIYPEGQVTAHNERFNLEQWEDLVKDSVRDQTRLAVFCCVDSIATRKRIWEATRSKAAFFVDGRMHGETLRVLASADPANDTEYPTSFFAQGEQFVGACTGRTTIYCSNVAAGVMLSQFAHWLRDMPLVPDQTLDLFASEMVLGAEAAMAA